MSRYSRQVSVPALGAEGQRILGQARVVFCCRSGQCAWQAARRLSTRWDEQIALVATGTIQPPDKR